LGEIGQLHCVPEVANSILTDFEIFLPTLVNSSFKTPGHIEVAEGWGWPSRQTKLDFSIYSFLIFTVHDSLPYGAELSLNLPLLKSSAIEVTQVKQERS